MAAANGGKDAASFSSSAFEWVPPGRLEVIDSFAARLRFDVVTTGTAWLSK